MKIKPSTKTYNLQTKSYKLKTSAGFSLIELIVAIAIFAVIIGGVVLFSVRSIQAHTKSQAMQGAIDNARFAIEALNKKIRTSNSISGGSAGSDNNYSATDQVFVIDNVDRTKYCYKFDTANNKLVMGKVPTTDAVAYAATADCGDFTTFSDLVGNGGKIKITGDFYLKDTETTNNRRGFVTTVINIEYADSASTFAEKDLFTIQSSVSVRDY